MLRGTWDRLLYRWACWWLDSPRVGRIRQRLEGKLRRDAKTGLADLEAGRLIPAGDIFDSLAGFGPTVGYCSRCGEARQDFYTCRDGGHTIPKGDDAHGF